MPNRKFGATAMSGKGRLPASTRLAPSAALRGPSYGRGRSSREYWNRNSFAMFGVRRSEEHTSELQSLTNLVCRLLLEKKKETLHRAKPPLPSTRVSGGRSGG